jgi:hypothetical protein
MADRVTKLGEEALVNAGGAAVRVTKLGQEAAVHAPLANVRVTKLGVEVLRSVNVVPSATSGTFRFDAGLGTSWYLVPQLTDSGVELRDKVVKAFRATGKMTVPQFSVYGYGPEDEVNVTAIENGTDSNTGKIALPDSALVVQSPRQQVNVPNSVLHTIRLEGVWDGEGIPDRIDEIVYEVAQQGVRR